MKDHTCEYPQCINRAPSACPKCFHWLCPKHLKKHSCKIVDDWVTASPSMNALPGLFEALKPAEKDWREDLR